MRASQLYNFASLDVGLPKMVEGEEKAFEPMIEPAVPLPAEPNPLSNLAAIQGLLHPNITVPSGWKPGMPVELPSEFLKTGVKIGSESSGESGVAKRGSEEGDDEISCFVIVGVRMMGLRLVLLGREIAVRRTLFHN